MLKWHYPSNSGGITRKADGAVGVAATLEYDGDATGTFTKRYAFKTALKIFRRDAFDEKVEVFFVLASRLIVPLIDKAFVMQIRIGKVQGWNAAYEEELYSQEMDQNQAFG